MPEQIETGHGAVLFVFSGIDSGMVLVVAVRETQKNGWKLRQRVFLFFSSFFFKVEIKLKIKLLNLSIREEKEEEEEVKFLSFLLINERWMEREIELSYKFFELLLLKHGSLFFFFFAKIKPSN